ncbi:hypothetical protein V2J09_000683 [Rumex salicifolius]
MSSTSKRPPEEGNLSSLSSARHPHEDASSHPNTTPETAQDSRAGKAPRIESRDVDRQSPLQSVYRMPLSGSDSHTSHAVAGPENRLETRESKESRENKLDSSRDAKAEPRELYHQIAKIDKDGNFQSRGDDTKEMKYDRETHGDPKTDINTGNEIYGSSGGHSNWKVHHKGKIHMDGFENPEKMAWGGIAFADLIQLNHGLGFRTEREQGEVTEDVGENKVDFKGDDKYKDKERKRKEVKHRDWVDRDKADNRSSLPVNSSGNNHKEPIREEREGGRWEKDKKDVPIDKDRPKDKEKNYPIKEMWSAAEKEGLQTEKETVDRLSEKDNVALDQKRPREADVWRNADKEARDRGKEREVDVEGERPEQRIRCAEKDLKEGGDDAGFSSERECFAQGVVLKQGIVNLVSSPVARKKMGKPELLTIVYKVGECMQELFKVWKEYESSQADKNAESSLGGPTLEIKIPGEHVTATNRQVRGGQLWGTDVYTNDSDLVAVLMHMGYCRTSPNPPPPALQEVRVIIRVLPPQDFYVSSLRNNVRSRAWGAGIGCSYRVERCFLVKKGCEPREIERSLTHSSTIEPTLAPVAVERTMTTRAAASNALRQQRFVREVTLQYNLCNEPWIKYTINVVADKGLKKPMFTSARLKKGEVLYMETHFHRFELCFLAEKVMKTGSTSQSHEIEADNKSQNQISHAVNGERSNADGEVVDVFRFSRCKKNLPQGVMKQYGIPLPVDLLEVVEDNLDWEDVLWSQTGVWIGGKEYQLARVHFMSPN